MGHTDQVKIFDTTLRDGEQSPGAGMNHNEKLRIAKALAELGVDIIEAGFPIASPGDFDAVQAVSRGVQGPIIAGLARCQKGDIDRAAAALADAERARIHVFLATSAIHREYKLGMAKDEIIRKTREGVAYAKTFVEDIEFSAEDAARTEPEFLAEVIEAAIDEGATTVNIPDTVGYTLPGPFGRLIAYLKQYVSNIDQAVISVHCHNDLGLAVANSLAALEAGARQVECTINGIGERAGNCSLEEIVMALKTRRDHFHLETGIRTQGLVPTSRLVSSITGLSVQRNKAVVGKNAFAHEAGIHQHGVINHRETYEIMRPEDVGLTSNDLVLGKHSGRHALRKWAEEKGYALEENAFQSFFEAFKRLADKKKEIFDDDLAALIDGSIGTLSEPWQIQAVSSSQGTGMMPTASVSLEFTEDGIVHQEAACGDGPVEAIFRAVERIVDLPIRLQSYHIDSITSGTDAQGNVSIEAQIGSKSYRGHAVSTDILEASTQALINVVNRHLNTQQDPCRTRQETVTA